MKDHLQDLIAHTNQMGFVDLIKVTGDSNETKINAIADDRTVIVSGKFKTPHASFIGTYGLPNLSKLRTILSFEDYETDAVVEMKTQERDGEQVPSYIHFATKKGDFVNDYRLMSQGIVEEKVKAVKFAGATWNVEFSPQVANIQRMKRQATANNEETTFVTKTEKGDLKVYFGDVSSHSGNFIFEPAVQGTLSKGWAWPVKQFLSIMDLQGDKKVYISDQGAMKITVDSGIAEYEYLLPAQQR
jgi:hypothetical protein